MGRIFLVNDGGASVSTDGARTWTHGKGLSTLGLVNAAVLPRNGQRPAICIGTSDNSRFYTTNGGETWRTQDYLGGDNDCCFAETEATGRWSAKRGGQWSRITLTDEHATIRCDSMRFWHSTRRSSGWASSTHDWSRLSNTDSSVVRLGRRHVPGRSGEHGH